MRIKKVDPRNLPTSLRDPEGIRCGYIPQALDYVTPGLGDPNSSESSSVYVLDLSTPGAPRVIKRVKTGPRVGEIEDGIAAYSGSHPNSVAISPEAIYVANGNNDSISVLDPKTYEERQRIRLSLFTGGVERRLKGIQPVALALSPERKFLYVAEAGINAVGVMQLTGGGKNGHVIGHIPVGWWPSSLHVSRDGKTLYVANARGRGAGPNNTGSDVGSPKNTVFGTVSIVPIPDKR